MLWFQIDRLTLFPNSLVLFEEGRTVSVSRSHIPPVEKQDFLHCTHIDYLKLLRTTQPHISFSAMQMKQSQNSVINTLYLEGGRHHTILPLQMFGQRWGALAFTIFGNTAKGLSEQNLSRLKLLCEIWLSHWQHLMLARNLQQDANSMHSDSDKLLLLSKRQVSVLRLLCQGLSAKECAEQLHLSHRTIESHKYRMLDKLNLESHNELIQFALRNGLGLQEMPV
ncbi:hypothetical protein JCM19232_505 [Vibrio ishigakensis]|uniref:HTH luxR-type domain-containing protein n=1 Tax=Vibrio ishigakensis TaxID=1481914 RepID=A0A0B8P6I7_9VIBR|nr:hypothetical protein JCM19232_505 [Vibrio ishigakensis]